MINKEYTLNIQLPVRDSKKLCWRLSLETVLNYHSQYRNMLDDNEKKTFINAPEYYQSKGMNTFKHKEHIKNIYIEPIAGTNCNSLEHLNYDFFKTILEKHGPIYTFTSSRQSLHIVSIYGVRQRENGELFLEIQDNYNRRVISYSNFVEKEKLRQRVMERLLENPENPKNTYNADERKDYRSQTPLLHYYAGSKKFPALSTPNVSVDVNIISSG